MAHERRLGQLAQHLEGERSPARADVENPAGCVLPGGQHSNDTAEIRRPLFGSRLLRLDPPFDVGSRLPIVLAKRIRRSWNIVYSMPMRIAVLVKQIPVPEQLRFEGTRLARLGVDLEVSAYCRRANAKAVELAGDDGEVVVFTMGPPSAEDALREMLACGATRGVHLCDPAFAGADTLATARALAAAIRAEGPFDLILVGVNSLDADTGQVGPELAELLDLPFAAAVRELEVADGSFRARLELDDGYAEVEGPLPAVLSTAERLCDPSKAKPEQRVVVDAGLIRCVGRADLGLGPDDVGEAGSPPRRPGAGGGDRPPPPPRRQRGRGRRRPRGARCLRRGSRDGRPCGRTRGGRYRPRSVVLRRAGR